MTTHSRLIAYDLVIEAIRLVGPAMSKLKRHDRDLANQLHRAISSAALNAAEGDAVDGGNRRMRLQTALGSAREARAALEVAAAWGYLTVSDTAAAEAKLDRACAMPFGLLR